MSGHRCLCHRTAEQWTHPRRETAWRDEKDVRDVHKRVCGEKWEVPFRKTEYRHPWRRVGRMTKRLAWWTDLADVGSLLTHGIRRWRTWNVGEICGCI